MKSTDKVLHNLYVFHLSACDEAMLLNYFRSLKEPIFDIDYAIRVCSSDHRTEAMVYLYSMKSLHTEAVALALEIENLNLAKLCARKPSEIG